MVWVPGPPGGPSIHTLIDCVLSIDNIADLDDLLPDARSLWAVFLREGALQGRPRTMKWSSKSGHVSRFQEGANGHSHHDRLSESDLNVDLDSEQVTMFLNRGC